MDNIDDGNQGDKMTENSVVADKADKETIEKVVVQAAKKPTPTPGEPKKKKKKHNIWWIKVSVISLFLAAFFSFLSEMTASADHIVVIIILLLFLIFTSILFDAIGVAVTSCDVAPIASMASRKVRGAKTALWLVKNNSTVSSICNDVIGDIFGIISGACSAAIVIKIAMSLDDPWEKVLSIVISAVVSAVTIGGKAFMKNVAINNSKEFVMFVGRLLAPFNKDEKGTKTPKKKRSKMQANDENGENTQSDNGKK